MCSMPKVEGRSSSVTKVSEVEDAVKEVVLSWIMRVLDKLSTFTLHDHPAGPETTLLP